MKKIVQRLISIFLSITLMISILPISAIHAAEPYTILLSESGELREQTGFESNVDMVALSTHNVGTAAQLTSALNTPGDIVINLTADITYSVLSNQFASIVVENRTITLNLNNRTLDVQANPSHGPYGIGLYVRNNGQLVLNGNGNFNVAGTQSGVQVSNGIAEVTNANGTGADSTGVSASNGSNVTVRGTATGVRRGLYADESTVNVGGNVIATSPSNGNVVYAALDIGSGSTIAVGGNVSSLADNGTGVWATSWGSLSTVTVSGNVEGNAYGVRADRASRITVGGNIHTANGNTYYWGAVGAGAFQGGEVIINGEIGRYFSDYIYVGNRIGMWDYEPITTSPGYRTYTDNVSTIWVRGDIVAPPVESVTLDRDNILLAPGSTTVLYATILPTTANPNLIWVSDNKAIATVENLGQRRGRIITGSQQGWATITATTVDGGYSATCVIAVFNFSGGSGTAPSPFQVSTPVHLDNVRNFPDAFFIQMNDISMASWNNWEPIGGNGVPAFTGTYDGGKHKITGLMMNNPSGDAGLFGHIGVGGVVRDLGIEDTHIVDGQNVGSFAGFMSGGTLERCYAVINIAARSTGEVYAGGLVGYIEGHVDIRESYAKGTVEAIAIDQIVDRERIAAAGGLVGGYCGTVLIENSYTSDMIVEADSRVSVNTRANAIAGGLVGRNNNTGPIHSSWIQKSYSTAEIIATAVGNPGRTFTGALIGLDECSLCFLSPETQQHEHITRVGIADDSFYLSQEMTSNAGNWLSPNDPRIVGPSYSLPADVGKELNENQMTSPSIFRDAGWDIPSIWAFCSDPIINNSFPILSNLESVNYIPVSGLTMSETQITMSEGFEWQLTVAVEPNNATKGGVFWSIVSDDELSPGFNPDRPVATVTASGLVVAIRPGSAVITARSRDNSAIYAKCVVTVSSTRVATPSAKLHDKAGIFGLEVELSAPGAEIVYTTNNTDPVVDDKGEIVNGIKYTYPIPIRIDTYIKAQAFVTHGDEFVSRSPIAGFLYTVRQTNAPTSSHDDSEPLPFGTIVTFAGATPGSSLRYTATYATGDAEPTVPDEPTLDSEVLSSIPLYSSMKINAKAFHPSRFDSATVLFNFQAQVDAPVFFPGDGAEMPIFSPIIIESITPDSMVYYMIDGNEGIEIYSKNNIPKLRSKSMTIRAWAVKEGCVDSDIVTATFIQKDPPPIGEDIANGSTVGSGSKINLFCSDQNLHNVVIRYTIGIKGDDPEILPDSDSEIAWVSATGGGGISNPITIREDTIIWAQLFSSLTGDPIGDVDVAEFRYYVVTASPTVNHDWHLLALDDEIRLSSITENAEIWFTINGSEPDKDNGNGYIYLDAAPILVDDIGNIGDTIAIKAKAYRNELPPSKVVEFKYTIAEKVATPKKASGSPDTGFINRGTEIALQCDTVGSVIYYSTDGKEPTQNSIRYSSPIKVHYPQTIKVRAFKDNMVPSDSIEYSYGINPEAITLHTEGFTADLHYYVPDSEYADGIYTVNVVNIPATLFVDEDRKVSIVFAVGGGEPLINYGGLVTSEIIEALKAGKIISSIGGRQRVGAAAISLFKALYAADGTLANLSSALSDAGKVLGVVGNTMQFFDSLLSLARGSTHYQKAVYYGYAEGEVDKNGNIANLKGDMLIQYCRGGESTPKWVDAGNMGGAVVSTALIFSGPFAVLGLAVPSLNGKDAANHYISYDDGIEINYSTGRIMPVQNKSIVAKADYDSRNGLSLLSGLIYGEEHYLTIDLNANMYPSTYLFNETYEKGTKRIVLGGIFGNPKPIITKESFSHTGYLTRTNSMLTPSNTSVYNTSTLEESYDYELTPRKDFIGVWQNSADEYEVLQSSISPQTEPLIATVNGEKIMVFITEDSRRDDVNRTVLVYSLYDPVSKTWSAPLPVDANDDGTADFYLQIISDGKEMWVTWHNTKEILPANATLEDILKNAEISVARFDSKSRAFKDVTTLTRNNYLDTLPQIAIKGDGNPVVVWVSNENNNIPGLPLSDSSSVQSNDNVIMISEFNGISWSPAKAITPTIGAVVELSIGLLNGNIRVAYITDADNEYRTIDDRSLILVDLNGNIIKTLASDTAVSNPRFDKINNIDTLSWYELIEIPNGSAINGEETIFGTDIRSITADNGEIRSLLDAPEMPTTNYEIVNGDGMSAIIYPLFENGRGSFAARLFDKDNKSFGIPFKLKEMPNTGDFANYYSGLISDDGNFYIAYTATRMAIMGEGATAELIETNDLCIWEGAPLQNIRLAGMYYSDDVKPGQSLKVTAYVENIGGLPVSGFIVTVNDKPVIAYDVKVVEDDEVVELNGDLIPGQSAIIEFEIDVSSDMKPSNYVVKILPNDADFDERDNSYTLTLGYPNLALSLKKNDDNEFGAVTVTAEVRNLSDYAAKANLIVRRGELNGEILEIVDLGEITGHGSALPEPFIIDPRAFVPNGEELEALYFEVISDRQEVFIANTSDFVVIYAPHQDDIADTYSITGAVSSFNPRLGARIELQTLDGVVISNVNTETSNAGSAVAVVQSFSIDNVPPGTYKLVVTKRGHLGFTLNNVIITDSDVDLTTHQREDVRVLILRPGDLNNDTFINSLDTTLLLQNFGASTPDNMHMDLNGDGFINTADRVIIQQNFGHRPIEADMLDMEIV